MSRRSRFTTIVVLTAITATLIAFSIVSRPDLYEETDESEEDGETPEK